MTGTELPPGSVVLLEVVHGSRAYGIAGPESDLDVKGVFVGPPALYHGFLQGPDQVDLAKDHVLHEIRKFFTLAAACNPTAIEFLFAEPEDRRKVGPEGERLLSQRDAFLSKRVRDSFGRYALSQLKRIRTHRRWLLQPPAGKPERKTFGLPESRPLVNKEQRGAAEALIERGAFDPDEVPPNFLDRLAREKRFATAMTEWEQYESWRTHRNPARAEAEQRFGYDAKHAGHLIRLLRMASEILRDGVVRVRRPDAEDLKRIREGALGYDELVAEAEHLESGLDSLAAASALPDRADEAALNALCTGLVDQALRRTA